VPQDQELAASLSANYEASRAWLVTPPWFRPWISHEQAAMDVREWAHGNIPGLLQTDLSRLPATTVTASFR
jgi:hypothetical protein